MEPHQNPGEDSIAWLSRGAALLLAGDQQQGARAFQRALELAPSDHGLRNKVAEILTRHGPPEHAEPLVQQILAENPELAPAWTLLALLRQRQVRSAEAAEAIRRSLQLEPNHSAHSNLLSLFQFDDAASAEKLLTAHRHWDEAYAAALLPNPPPRVRPRDPARPLRLGFVSADFERHPTGFMVLPAVEHLDCSQCEVVCYSDSPRDDEYTARFRAAATAFRHTLKISDKELAEQIRRDEIDILFDLMGHHGPRLLVFARKPAPVQITWFGYVGTTGLKAMDFLLADRFHVPSGEEGQYAETILRMPHGYACYGPPPDAPPIGPLPALAAGRVTFGSLNNPAKFSQGTLDAWAQILHRVPEALLLLAYRGFEQEALQDRIKVEFAQRHISPGRINLQPWISPRELLQTYNRIDLALDTQPYSGGLTTCEALWMGVPVITCPGPTFASRHATSHLTSAGYPQFVALDASGCIELAVHWASRLNELAAIRAGLRDQIRQSHLCDASGFARDFLALLQQAWQLRAAAG